MHNIHKIQIMQNVIIPDTTKFAESCFYIVKSCIAHSKQNGAAAPPLLVFTWIPRSGSGRGRERFSSPASERTHKRQLFERDPPATMHWSRKQLDTRL